MSPEVRLKPLHAALLIALAAPAYAAEEGEPEAGAEQPVTNLPMFTVTTSAPDIDPNIPANTATISEEVLDRLNMPTAEDSLRYLPNLNVRQRYIGDRNAALEVRGMSNIQSARGLVMADGVLLSNFLGSDHQNSPRWSLVLPEEIERVDVIYGPYSALYSGNAMGAAVIYTTQMPDDFEASAKLTAHRQDFDVNGTDDTYDGHVLNALVGDRMGRFSYLLGVSTLEFTGQPTGWAFLTPGTTALQGGETEIASGAYLIKDRRGDDRYHIGVTGSGIETTEQDEFKLKLGYDLTPELEGRFTLASWTNDSLTGEPEYTTYLRDTNGDLVYSGPVNIDGFRYNIGNGVFAPRSGAEENWMYAATLKSKHSEGWNYQAAASIYDQAENDQRTSSVPSNIAYSTGGGGTLSRREGSGWWNLDFKADNKFGENAEHWLTVGAHHSNYDLEQKNYTIDDWRDGEPVSQTAANQGTTEISAVFAQDAWQFAEQWKTVFGLRVENWKASNGSRSNTTETIAYEDRSESAVSPKAALEYTPNPDWRYRLSLAQSTRFPTVDELYQGSISANEIIASDPDLKPEEALSIDYTIETALDNAIMRVSFWAEDAHDTIFRYLNQNTDDDNFNQTLYLNVDHVRIRGIEWVYDTWTLFGVQGLDLHTNVAFNESEVLKDSEDSNNVGNEFYRIPRIRSAFALTYHQSDKLDYTLGGRYSGRSRASLDNSDTNRHAIDAVSNFTVFDARINYDVNEHLEVGAGINNLLDERYYVSHPYQGRTLFADVKVSY
ncbi:MAG: TonB-dependent receptor [Acetobacteraceae bacterium]|uniref:TonB-dependent receptor n=1 Tax=Bradyrhizobium sp. TaxID=376 RepID=UPI003D0DE51A